MKKQTPLILRSAKAERFTKVSAIANEAICNDRSAKAERKAELSTIRW